jgi:hypothetical protein
MKQNGYIFEVSTRPFTELCPELPVLSGHYTTFSGRRQDKESDIESPSLCFYPLTERVWGEPSEWVDTFLWVVKMYDLKTM